MHPDLYRKANAVTRILIMVCLIAILGMPMLTALAEPASFFDTDLAQGKTRFRTVVDSATGGTAVFYERTFSSSTTNVFSVDGDDGSTAWVRATKAGAAISFSSPQSGGYYHTWGVSVSSWNEVVNEGIKFEFFEDSALTTPLEVNAFGVQTYDWGTCCLGPNYTPTGTALGTAIYTVFDGGTLGPAVELLGNITATISSTIHFVAEIDDRDETFTEVTVAPNGSGEQFGMGGYVIFSLVPEDSVPPGSGSTPSIPPERPDLTDASDLGISSTDNLTSDTTPDFNVTYTPQNEIDFVNLYSGSTLIATSSAAGTTDPITVTLTSTLLSQGVHTITARVENGYWHDESDPSPSLTITIDATPPTMTITAAEVSDGETSNHAALSLTFTSSESTSSFASGDVVVTNGSLSGFSGSGTTYTATLTPAADGEVTVNVPAGAYADNAGNANLAAAEFNWTSDQTPPTVEFNPVHGATIVANAADIILTLSEPIRRAADNAELTDSNIDVHITLKFDDASGSNIAFDATIDVDKQVITIDPDAVLPSNQQIYVAIGTTVEDYANNPLANSSATFFTADENLPTLSASTPSDGSTGVSVNTDLVLYFSEAVYAQTGDIEVRHTVGGSLFESIPVTSMQVSGSGTDTISVDISGPLASLTGYYILIDGTAFEDADSNAYTGILSPSTLNFTTEYLDVVAPTVTFNPTDGATGVSVSANITLTFSEAVRNLDDTALTDANVDALITLRDTDASGALIPFDATIDAAKEVITVNPTSNFSSEQVVYIAIGSTVEDSSNNPLSPSSATFTTADVLPPTLLSTSPVDGATDVGITSNLMMGFSESVVAQFGTITIYRSADDSIFESMSVTSPSQVSGSGTATITINPSNTFDYNTGYYLQVDSTAFDDASGNAYAGISDSTTWNFTTAAPDVTPPALQSTSPVDDASSVDISANLLMTFSEPVMAQSGTVSIYHTADDSLFESIEITSPGQVGGDGTDTITINPSAPFEYNTGYYVQVASTALEDASGNPYAGIADSTTWNFTTRLAPDSDHDGIIDSIDGTGDRDSDGIVNYLDYDPTGYLYNGSTGEILSGGLVSVSGPGSVTLIEDGSTGYYQFSTDATPGIYTISVTLPPGYEFSSNCLRSDPPAFDPTGWTEPVVLGNGENGSTGFLTSSTCTTFYLSFDLAAGDPIIINNNIPLLSRTLPVTGFAPGRITFLDQQPLTASYTDMHRMWLEIPSIGVKTEVVGIPAMDGEWDVSWLGDRVGYLEGSAFPTWSGNTVITGHVWGADNKPGVFMNVKYLRYDDNIRIHAWGSVYTYQVRSNLRIAPYKSDLVFAHKELDWITLLTCEGFTADRGDYSSRRMVQAVLISVRPER